MYRSIIITTLLAILAGGSASAAITAPNGNLVHSSITFEWNDELIREDYRVSVYANGERFYRQLHTGKSATISVPSYIENGSKIRVVVWAGSGNFSFKSYTFDNKATSTPQSVTDLLAELGCSPGQKIEATDTEEWACVDITAHCDPVIASLWATTSQKALLESPKWELGEIVVDEVRENVPGVCTASVTTNHYPGGDAYESFYFQISRSSKSLKFEYADDSGEDVLDPVVFPIPASDTFEACWIMLGCDALPSSGI